MTIAEAPVTAEHTGDLTKDELLEVLQSQRQAFLSEGIPSAETRLNRIDRFVAAVLEAAEEISSALDEDFGSRSRTMNLVSEILGAVGAADTVRENLSDWMKDREVPGSAELGTPSFVQIRPKGVVGVIGPWNFPVLLVVHPTIDALAAGNRVMIKFSDIPQRTADVFAKAIASRMDPDEVSVVRGGLDTARAFSDLPFDHIIFTGSPTVGAQVAEVAGRNLVPVTLELGGKNPVVVSSKADIPLAAKRIAGFRLTNGGQICLCPDYLFVPTALKEDFLAAYESAVREFFPSYLDHAGVVSIVNDRNFDRVVGLIDDAVAKGARAISIADPAENAVLPDRAKRRIAPTVLLDVTPEMTIASEEIFGPVTVLYTYDDLADVIDYVNSQPSPLAAYWFGPDDAQYRTFLEHTTSGGVTRNDLGVHWGIEGAPSGGVGRSGMGAYTGLTGFTTFSHLRTVASSETDVTLPALVLSDSREQADGLAAAVGQALQVINDRIARAES